MKRPLFVARQASHPSGPLGRFIAWVMSHETARENGRTLELLDVRPDDRVLEVGFAHGRTIARAAALAPRGFIAGTEVSDEMLQMAKRHNRRAVREGRVELQRVDGPDLPYGDASFDRVFSVHTIYFWPDAAERLREIRRVLEPAGRLVLAFRYGPRVIAELPAPIYVHRSPEEVATLLREAGWDSVSVHADGSALHLAIAAMTKEPAPAL